MHQTYTKGHLWCTKPILKDIFIGVPQTRGEKEPPLVGAKKPTASSTLPMLAWPDRPPDDHWLADFLPYLLLTKQMAVTPAAELLYWYLSRPVSPSHIWNVTIVIIMTLEFQSTMLPLSVPLILPWKLFSFHKPFLQFHCPPPPPCEPYSIVHY